MGKITKKRIIDWLASQRDKQIEDMNKSKNAERRLVIEVIMDNIGVDVLVAEEQYKLDGIYLHLDRIFDTIADEDLAKYRYSTQHLMSLRELSTTGNNKGLRHFIRNAIEWQTPELDAINHKWAEQKEAVKNEWRKLIANVEGRRNTKEALEYLRNTGIDIKPLEELYREEQEHLPATKINLDILNIGGK